MTCNDKCIHYPVCEQKNWDFANIDECKYYAETFERPQGVWIRKEKYAAYVKDMFDRDFTSEFFDKAALDKLLDDHVAGRANNAREIYTVLSFLIWYEQYFVLR